MATVAHVIDMLRRRQREFEHEGLINPKGKEAFDFGVVCGTAQAYEQMLADINDMLEEEKQAEKRREQSQ